MTIVSKNVQVIDGARNAAYNIYSLPDADFALMFPDGQDIEFAEDFWDRIGEDRAGAIAKSMYKNYVLKPQANGIHGTFFIDLKWQKGDLYPNKRFSDDPTSSF